MTVRNLDALFKPKSIAIVGASKTSQSVGAVLARNLFKAGFDGPVMPVNPKHQAIEGVLTYADIASLPVTPDLAVISTPPESVPGIIADLGRRGTRGAVVITAGFGESRDARGKQLQQQVLDAAKPHLLRIIGPNCLGILVPGIGLNASFAHVAPKLGHLAFVAQSGAIVTSIIDWAHSRNIGFSQLVSLGDMADVDFGDMLDYLANDPNTHAILLYVEAVTHTRKFMSAARAAARMKPCIVVKAGRNAEGARAAASHTGALAGADAVYDAAFRRAGMLRVYSLEQLFDAVEILGLASAAIKGPRLAIVTNGGGIGVLATDHLIDEGGQLAELSANTLATLNTVLPPTWSHGNPIDIIGDAPGSRYRAALDTLLDAPEVDAILLLNCPTAVASGSEAAQAVTAGLAQKPGPLVLTSWVGDSAARAARRLFRDHGIPTYATPEQAVRAFMYLVRYRRGQEQLMQTPPSAPEEFTPDAESARALVDQALADQRTWLTEPEAKALLNAYAIPAVPTRVAADPDAAAAAAAEFAGPVALKILSRDITHKSDLGGVALGLLGPGAVRDAAVAMAARIRAARPDAALDGFSVQPMVNRPGAYELIVGMATDPQFGPVILFGHGGTAVEVVADKSLGLPPLNMHLARELIANTRIYRLLQGYRGQASVNLDAVAETLLKVAQLAIDLPALCELDINPLLADPYGVIALDARVKLQAAPARERLAIRPYPKSLERDLTLRDGRKVFLRPIRPEDEPMLQAAFAQFTPEQIRLRFFIPVKTLSHVTAARFTQIDYDREMSLIATERGPAGKTEIYGVVSLNADPDIERGEYGIIVRDDMTRKGLGRQLMRQIIDYAKTRGMREVYGDVLAENAIMLTLCASLGFTEAKGTNEPGIVRVKLDF